MKTLLAIDPGNTQSAWVVLVQTGEIVDKGITENEHMRQWLSKPGELKAWGIDLMVMEYFRARGMPTANEEMDTIFWSGRFVEIACQQGVPWAPITRIQEKVQLCGVGNAKDSNISLALRDAWGGDKIAKGTKKAPGPLFGFADDMWAALAIGVTWFRREVDPLWEPKDEFKAKPTMPGDGEGDSPKGRSRGRGKQAAGGGESVD